MSPTHVVTSTLGVGADAVCAAHAGELGLLARAADVPGFADRIVHELGGRLLSLFASDDRQATGAFTVHQVWSLPRLQTFLHVVAPVDPVTASFPSIAAAHPAANWFEREIMDVFGLSPEGHPNPTPVAVHDDWPAGSWSLRKDVPDDQVLSLIHI